MNAKEQAQADLERYEKLLADLMARRIAPKEIVGTGYKNPRQVAIDWLNERIAKTKEALSK